MQQDAHAGLRRERLPDDLEVLGEVGHAGAGAVRVRPLDDRTERAQRRRRRRRRCRRRPCAARRARRVEAVERVEDRGARAAEERQLLDEERPRRPPRAAAIAAVDPAEPAPTTHTSTSARSGRSAVRGSRRRLRRSVETTRPAAVDRQQLAGHGPRLVGQEVDRRLGDLDPGPASRRPAAACARRTPGCASSARGARGHRRRGQRRAPRR